MTRQAPNYHGYRFPPEIISHAVWLYHRFCLSFRDAEDLLAQRGVTITYETIRQWCRTFGPEYARTLRRRRDRRPGRASTSLGHEPRKKPRTSLQSSSAPRNLPFHNRLLILR